MYHIEEEDEVEAGVVEEVNLSKLLILNYEVGFTISMRNLRMFSTRGRGFGYRPY